jgi:hypothetical protein
MMSPATPAASKARLDGSGIMEARFSCDVLAAAAPGPSALALENGKRTAVRIKHAARENTNSGTPHHTTGHNECCKYG